MTSRMFTKSYPIMGTLIAEPDCYADVWKNHANSVNLHTSHRFSNNSRPFRYRHRAQHSAILGPARALQFTLTARTIPSLPVELSLLAARSRRPPTQAVHVPVKGPRRSSRDANEHAKHACLSIRARTRSHLTMVARRQC